MTESFKGLKLLRTPGAKRIKTPPTPGSTSQLRKLNRDAHRNGPHSKKAK